MLANALYEDSVSITEWASYKHGKGERKRQIQNYKFTLLLEKTKNMPDTPFIFITQSVSKI